MPRMRRSEIVIRRGKRERRIVLGPFASMLATTVVAAVAIVVLAVAIVLGYIALGVGLAAALVVLVAAVLRGAWSSMKR